MWYVENLLYIMEMVYENCFICNGHNIESVIICNRKGLLKMCWGFCYICDGNGLYAMEIKYANCITCNGNITLGFQYVMEIMGFRVYI